MVAKYSHDIIRVYQVAPTFSVMKSDWQEVVVDTRAIGLCRTPISTEITARLVA